MKTIRTALLAFCLAALCAGQAAAGEKIPFMDDSAYRSSAAKGTRVFDGADILTDEQELVLQLRLSEFEKRSGHAAVIVTCAHVPEGSGRETFDAFVDMLYQEGRFKPGEYRDGSLLLMDTAGGPWIVSYDAAIRYIDHPDIYAIFHTHSGGISPLIQRKQYYTAFTQYIDTFTMLYDTQKERGPGDSAGPAPRVIRLNEEEGE